MTKMKFFLGVVIFAIAFTIFQNTIHAPKYKKWNVFFDTEQGVKKRIQVVSIRRPYIEIVDKTTFLMQDGKPIGENIKNLITQQDEK